MRRFGNFDFDDNQPALIRALEAAGGVVTRLDKLGDGCPDLLVGFRRRWFLLEVKNPEAKPSKQRLTKAQRVWHAAQRRHGAPLFVVFTPKQALAAIGAAP